MGKQHYLSQCYLKGFSVDDKEKTIFCYDRKNSKFITSDEQNDIVKIKNIGYKNDGFWSAETESKITDIEREFGREIKDFKQKSDITKLTHSNLMKFIMMQLIRSQIAGNSYGEILEKDIQVIQDYFGNIIENSEFRSKALDHFISRIHDDNDTNGLCSFKKRSMYISKISGTDSFITTVFPFMHDPTGYIHFPLTMEHIIQIAPEKSQNIIWHTSRLWNSFRVNAFNKQFINAHSDNVYIFGATKNDIELAIK